MRSNKRVGTLIKSKEKNLLTADVSNALQALSGNVFWKNNTNKVQMLQTAKAPGKSMGGNNQMTEADIDRLFANPQKSKAKTQLDQQEWGSVENKDFMNTIKFLRMQDCYDKLLTGLPPKQNQNFIQPGILQQLKNLQKCQDLTHKFKKNFLVGKIIGQGAYASVRVAIYKPLNKKIAIKVYQKNKIKQNQRKKSVRREIQILQLLNHPNIVRIYDVVQTNNHLNLVMEYLDGISLNTFMKNQTNHRISQNKCRKIIKGLAEALKHLHKMRIAHRDLKLENVILNDHLSPKLIDFGFSTCLQKNKKYKIFCGTPSYMAPEIVQKKQYAGEKADIWALGVLFFVCFTGYFPFKGSTDQELYGKINRADYAKVDIAVSKDVSQLIGKMLKINPEQRITASQILSHSWFKNSECSNLTTQGSQSKKKRNKCLESSSNQLKKRLTTMSSHKSKQSWNNKQIKKLTQTYKQNLKLELKSVKQPSAISNSTYTNRKLQKEKQNRQNLFTKTQKMEGSGLFGVKNQKMKRDKRKNDTKILQIFRNEIKVRGQKSKSRSRNN